MNRNQFSKIIAAADLGALADEDQPIGEAINRVYGAAWGHHAPWMRELEVSDELSGDLEAALKRLNAAYDDNGYATDASEALAATWPVCSALDRIADALTRAVDAPYTIVAELPDGQAFDDEAHVGLYAGKRLTEAQALEALADLDASRPSGHEGVMYRMDDTP